MTQRFGRNQRRRAREALAVASTQIMALEALRELDTMRLGNLAHKVLLLKTELDEAKGIAGRMSIVFPAQTLKLNIEAQESILDFVHTPMGSLSEYQSMDLQAQCIQSQTLPVLLAKIDRNSLDRAVHMVVEFRDKRAGYAISEDGLQSRTGAAMLAELKRSLPRVINVQLFGARR